MLYGQVHFTEEAWELLAAFLEEVLRGGKHLLQRAWLGPLGEKCRIPGTGAIWKHCHRDPLKSDMTGAT